MITSVAVAVSQLWPVSLPLPEDGVGISKWHGPIVSESLAQALKLVPKRGRLVGDVMRPSGDGRALHIAIPRVAMADAAALAITDEPAGGQPQPTTETVCVGPLG